MGLEKAYLESENGDKIEFQFNPTKVSFSQKSKVEATDAEDETGNPKQTFKKRCPRKIQISELRFDTYESGESVVEKYLYKFIKALEYDSSKERPLTYSFNWGGNQYIKRCFITDLSFDLTLFLPDGTPVQAVVSSLSLEEIEETSSSGSTNPFGRGSTPNR
ncbi:MAG: hypothetical protein AAGG51_28775 [Cyanobacteria bacterium P01_G01_bin.54]